MYLGCNSVHSVVFYCSIKFLDFPDSRLPRSVLRPTLNKIKSCIFVLIGMFQANFMFTLMYFQKFHYQSTVFLSHRFEYHLCLDGELVTFGYW